MNQGEKIKHLIKIAGFTQNSFAKAMGYSGRSAFTSLLNYETLPPDFLKKALKILKIEEKEFEENVLDIKASRDRSPGNETVVLLEEIIEAKDVTIRALENSIHAQNASINLLKEKIEELEQKIKTLKQKT